MKTVYVYVYICICMLLCSCTYSKWNNREDLIGDWVSDYSFCSDAKISFHADGTCDVTGIPTYKMYFGEPNPTLKWYGNQAFKDKYPSLETWDFSGFWQIKEDTLYDDLLDTFLILPYYRYQIWMSPYQEMLGTKQECDSFMNSSNAEDVFLVKIYAWTQSFFSPGQLHYLYFYVLGPDDDYCFHKMK